MAGILAESPLLRRGKRLWQENEKNRNRPMSTLDKLCAGGYIILHDYVQGLFPPSFRDRQKLYSDERNYRALVPGSTPAELERGEMLKPFWFGKPMQGFLRDFLQLAQTLELAGLQPPAKLLELGGGAGWTAEFLAQAGFAIVSTTISPDDVASGRKRIEALRVKGVAAELQFVASPMESVAENVRPYCPFDGVFVFAALHHAFDWRATLSSSFLCLRPGGWLLICNEPNVLHTAISYRAARLTSTHEIGLSKKALLQHLKATGFSRVISMGKQPQLFFRPHWLLAQKEHRSG